MESIDRLREYVKDAPASSMGEMARAIVAGMADEIEREAADMVPLPVDADGVPIHIGDWITGKWDAKAKVVAITSEDVYWWEPDGCHWCHAYEVCHHHAPTVEDVLREFAYGLGVPVADSYVAATAAKLRLAEGSE